MLSLISQLLTRHSRSSNIYPLLDNLCILGLINETRRLLPNLNSSESKFDGPRQVFSEAAKVVSKIVRYGSTLRMFVAAGGIETIANLLLMGCTWSDQPKFSVFCAVDAAWNVLHYLHSSTCRTNLCLLMTRQNMLGSLTKALRVVAKDSERSEPNFKWTFTPLAQDNGQLARSDIAVCQHKVCTDPIC